MTEFKFKVKKMGELTFCHELDPFGNSRRTILLESLEYDEAERDEIQAFLWDDMTHLDVQEGDKVLVTLQFRLHLLPDGTYLQTADVIEIQKVRDYIVSW